MRSCLAVFAVGACLLAAPAIAQQEPAHSGRAPDAAKPPQDIAVDGFGGVKHLGVWPLADAAEACFGAREWPAHLPVPQASLEFEVADVAAAAAELEAAGHTLLHGARTEPWGQEIARLLGPEGLLVGVCFTPWLHEDGPGAAQG